MHLIYDLINQADWFNNFWFDHQSTLYLWHLLGVHCSCTWIMFCSSAHRKISFKTWFFQIFFNKSLIKCEKFISCLMQYSKKYWKWPETYVLILDSYWTPQFQNFAIPPIWKKFRTLFFQMLFSKSLIILCYNVIFALNICVNKKAPPTYSVHWGLK